MTREADVQLEIQRYVVQSGGYVVKTHGSAISGAGVPDLIGWLPLRSEIRDGLPWGVVPFAVEVKTEKTVKKTTPLQEQVIQTCLRAGGASGVATGVITFQKIIAAWIHRNVLWGETSIPGAAASLEDVMDTIGITVGSVGDDDDNNEVVEPPEVDGEVDGDAPELSDSGGDEDGQDSSDFEEMLGNPFRWDDISRFP